MAVHVVSVNKALRFSLAGSHIRLEGGKGAGEDMSSGSLERFREFSLGPRFAAELLGRSGLQCVSLCPLEKNWAVPTPYCFCASTVNFGFD